MKAEEQLINDILVIEEKIMYEKDYDNPQQSNINKLHARQLRAVKQYTKERAVEFAAMVTGDNMDEEYDEWYDQFKE